ncbi:histidine kinase [Umezawaea sp. Da 62-37]|uniref:sensor histidine kinase n=1 Tax=Umezawaea sp. Da 62-37 TaxID=3075927 RepID=UPI0028F7044E|nr:histidine kinase [Umezawaea sp. Da 62-37]WNV86008.1 histidine kinase [Umezawaea sp. Da 62-37]
MTDPAPDRQWPKAWRFLIVTAFKGLAALGLLMGMILCAALIVTLPLLPRLIEIAHRFATGERDRTARFLGTATRRPPGNAVAITPDTRRDLRWLVLQAGVGMVVGFVAAGTPLGALQNVVIAAFWWTIPDVTTTLAMPVLSWGDALLALATAAGYALVGVLIVPPVARWYAKLSANWLAPPKKSLTERLAEVTETRAAALEAHGTELRRIERNLHDGTQNRLVAVVMHLGMVERALARDPASALPMVHTAQNAATDALAELREVVRGIYPPVLVDRGLSGAVASLAGHCAIPCTVDEHPLPRMPAAVEAAAYFVVAEALTNAVKHSGAERITVSLRDDSGVLVVEVTDDGLGGADEAGGSGLVGIRRRVAAFDGTTTVVSPQGGPTVVRVDIPAGS